MECTVVNIV